MDFEFDPQKSGHNKQKHGVDFHAAQALWNDSDVIEIPLQTTDEPRYLIIGKYLKNTGWGLLSTEMQLYGLSLSGDQE